MTDEVILVNEKDEAIGRMEKLEAHEKGLLHRAFSIFVFNSKGELLLQRRAQNKYHSAGLWTNTCCSHPLPGENTGDAARRRLKEEMGFVTELKEFSVFTYKSVFENGLTEHEIDHVFTGVFDADPEINTEEVSEFAYKSLLEIRKELALHPENYTTWFKIAIEKLF